MIKKLHFILLLAVFFVGKLSIAQTIAGGGDHTLFICGDGSIKSVGFNGAYQLGYQTSSNQLSLPEKISSLTGMYSAVSAGREHSLFLKNDGSVWACGSNSLGACGLGNITTNQVTPAQISGLSGTITKIAAGGDHSLFLKSDGTVWCSGKNNMGQLGIGNTTKQLSPVQVSNLSNIIAIAAGSEFSLFLKNDGTVWGSGYNAYGQLGTGNNINSNVPVQVQDANGPLTGVIAIAAGGNTSLFLKNDGTVSICGKDIFKLGSMNKTEVRYKAFSIPNLSNISAIAVGAEHCLFLKNDGTVWGKGNASYGRLGDDASSSPNFRNSSQIIGLNGITEIAAGSVSSLFRKNDGTIWVCGYNGSGTLGIGTNTNGQTLTNMGQGCPPPAPPQVDYSSMPNTTCVGSNVDFGPSISGSNPVEAVSLNNINIANPKAIDKNSHAVFVLDDNDQITKFDFNGSVVGLFPNLSIAGIQAFTVDDSSNVYIFNGDGSVYKCDSTGTLVNTQTTLWLGSNANDLAITTPVNPASYPENLFLVDNTPGASALITGIDTHNNDSFSNSNIYPTNSNYIPKATSISIDNFYSFKRVLMADPVNGTLRSRILYSDGSSGFDYKDGYLVDSSLTASYGFDFINSDTTFKIITVSSATTGKLGVVYSGRDPDGTEVSFFNSDVVTSLINPVQPVGMITTKFGSSYQFWIADRGQNKLIRAFVYNYQITPPLPEGLTFNNSTGKIEGSPKAASSPQTYQIVMASPLGNDTTYVTFAITPSSGVSNAVGTNNSSATHKDGMEIKYFDPYTCNSLVELKDNIGGTSPGSTEVIQYVRPTIITVGNKTFVRRSTTITSEQNENINGSLKLMYSFDDIKEYNLANPADPICNMGGTSCNDTIVGEIMVSVLQMHESVNTVTGFLGKDPIIHNPVRATWNSSLHMWVTDNIIIDKLSDFYAGPTSNATGFDCKNEGADTLTSNDYYVWLTDTLFASGDYIDTLVNTTGCDSIARLHLIINNTTGLSESASSSSIRLFPNPSKGLLTVAFTSSAITPERIRIQNVLGNEVYNQAANGNTQLDLTSFNSGIYFVSIDTKDKTFVYRIIKE